jgi:hypothetical protein
MCPREADVDAVEKCDHRGKEGDELPARLADSASDMILCHGFSLAAPEEYAFGG